MPPFQQSSRIDIFELKARILKKIGHQKADKYFHHLQRFLSLKVSKREFNKLCLSTIGRENVDLHNRFILSILKNASLSKTGPVLVTKEEASSNSKVSNGYPRDLQSLCGDAFPPSPRKSRSAKTRGCKFRDHPSPLGPNGKIQRVPHEKSDSRPTEKVQKLSSSSDLKGFQEQRSAQEVISIGSKALAEVVSVEDGEEVEQAGGSPCSQSRSPVRPPFGIAMSIGGARKALCNDSVTRFHISMSETHETCCSSAVLPDCKTLRERLEQRLNLEGLSVSVDCVNLLNNGLDAFLKRLIKPCLNLAQARCSPEQVMVNSRVQTSSIPGKYVPRSNQCFSASLLDFRAAMESNPQLLGQDWPVQLEKICLRSLEE
ncbi:hypothetical protein MRB53_017430 [Persea americana]|uniref:Uncharacterized protein n=1 Tax=Persea americana TaxID=3435 RepID=A0ACC2M4N4_PERAE|nr:hypothetical protein MRB53_017430 [Persea americana]|eukprot:TRINITY_DN4160_c0_g2_i4.p1 TRINITY_DN4160_c0_g2~~TRINITY_DN4160_c0_g2_i4.p1  ORF type:complete len:373 (-),score=69.70 TRINITY_DN4160_c0_g2_i4:813-1931(-)